MSKRLLVIAGICFLALAQARSSGDADTSALGRITTEGMEHSKVMELMSWMTDVQGPRLTGSPRYKKAAEWARKTLTEMGLSNSRLEGWGPFGKGWELERHSAHMIAPYAFPVISFPKAWSPGSGGKKQGDVVYLNVETDSALQTYRGKLGGKFVLMSEPRIIAPRFSAEATRKTEADLLELANATASEPRRRRNRQLTGEQREKRMVAYEGLLMAEKEGALALLSVSRGDGGNVFVQQATVPTHPDTPFTRRVSAWDEDAPEILPQVVLGGEHYNQIVRMLQKGEKVRMEMETRVKFFDVDSGYNILAEIPGSDLKEEVVMIGAHFDSWHGGTGATDDGAGAGICMEAMRILKATGLQPRRTIRIALWGGEEQGLLGSKAYVKRHLGELMGPDTNRATKHTLASTKFSVYFNLDNGGGKIRGVYMQGNEQVRPLFRAWLKPLEGLGASTLSLAGTGSTDHMSFDEIGLPGFQFIQDEMEYSTRTHHSTMDLYERLVEEDMKQASVVMAAFAYQAAMADGLLPRKPIKNVMLDWAPEVYTPGK